MNKKNYVTPEIFTVLVRGDIITYSETEEWKGPTIIIKADSKEETNI